MLSHCVSYGYSVSTPCETLRIAHDAASAKRALHILRRVGHTRYLTDQGAIKGLKVDRELKLADVGTHYCSREVMALFVQK